MNTLPEDLLARLRAALDDLTEEVDSTQPGQEEEVLRVLDETLGVKYAAEVVEKLAGRVRHAKRLSKVVHALPVQKMDLIMWEFPQQK